MSKISFFRTAIKDHHVAAIGPSSKFAVQQVIKLLPNYCNTIVEYGAGDGVITKELLKRLPPTGKLFAIETNSAFILKLKKIQDTRLVVIPHSVVDVLAQPATYGISAVDAIVSGIPFSFFNAQQRRQIVAISYQLLATTGHFIVYQVSPLMLSYLRKEFGKHTKLRIEFRNLPLYFIMSAKKLSPG